MDLDSAYFKQVAARAEELEQAMSGPGAASNPRTFKELVREMAEKGETFYGNFAGTQKAAA